MYNQFTKSQIPAIVILDNINRLNINEKKQTWGKMIGGGNLNTNNRESVLMYVILHLSSMVGGFHN